MTTEEAFIKVLQMHGIEHAFGIIGSAMMPVSDLFPKAGITFWDCAHETNAGLMGDGYSRATGKMSMVVPQQGGVFDAAKLEPTSPPMISADPSDGTMRLVLPDMMMTFTNAGTPVAKAALNASVELKIAPVNNGYGVAIQLGTPTINIDILDDIPNLTHLTNDDLSQAVELGMNGQIAQISALLGGIPLPSMAGLQMTDLSVGGTDGYVMIAGALK